MRRGRGLSGRAYFRRLRRAYSVCARRNDHRHQRPRQKHGTLFVAAGRPGLGWALLPSNSYLYKRWKGLFILEVLDGKVDLVADFLELFAHLMHAFLHRCVHICPVALLFGVGAHVLRDTHRTELGSAHAAEVSRLARIGGDGLVVHVPRGDRIQGEVELIVPAELETSLGQRVVPVLSPRVRLGEVGGVSRDAVRDDPGLHVVPVGQTQVLLRGDVAQHRGAHRADVRGTDGAGDVVIARGDVRGERPERVERGLVAPVELVAHVLGDLVERDVARSLVHHLHVLLPRPLGELPLHLELSELSFVVGVLDAARAQSVSDGQADVVLVADVEDVVPVLVGEVLRVGREAELRVDAAAAGHDPRQALGSQRNEAKQHTGMDGPVVDALLGLLDERLAEDFPGEVLGDAVHLLQRLVDGHRADRQGAVADDPLARLVDVLARAEVHEGVGAPQGAPLQLLHLFLDVGRDGGVADVGVDLHLEHAPDDHGLALRVVLVGRDDRPAARHLAANELGVHALPLGHERHLLRDEAALGVVHLRAHRLLAVALVAAANPAGAQLRNALARVMAERAAGVVHVEELAAGVLVAQMDPAQRHTEGLSRLVVNHVLVHLLGAGIGFFELQHIAELRVQRIAGDARPAQRAGLRLSGLGRDHHAQGAPCTQNLREQHST
eukprot:scaffold1280_cov246-Pinguiococcus_pyrenoidosus.AAC.14